MQTKITSLFSSAPQANRFWKVDNFSDDTECLLVVVCWKIRLSKKCNPCHRLSVGFSNQLFDIVQREGNDS